MQSLSTSPHNFIDARAIQRYVSRRGEEIEHCSVALERKDFSVLRETAHKILGNCTTFGFEELQDIAATLHRSAVSEDRESCNAALTKLKDWVSINRSTVAAD